jgi:hypothetical protein
LHNRHATVGTSLRDCARSATHVGRCLLLRLREHESFNSRTPLARQFAAMIVECPTRLGDPAKKPGTVQLRNIACRG